MNVLCFLQQKKYPDSALAWKQRLAAASVLPDNISSQVTVYGIHLERENGTYYFKLNAKIGLVKR